MMIKVHAIPSFEDNYIWLVQFSDQRAVVVDPGDGLRVREALQQTGLSLAAILITHHHWDHIDGIETLLQQNKVPVYGPDRHDIPGLSHPVGDGDHICIDDLQLTVMAVPGHTPDHRAYYGHGMLFCGDTLFAAGCGRLLGGTAAQLHQSLQRLAALPETTQVYCAHEYTLANLRFAQAVEPGNPRLAQRTLEEQAKREQGQPTLPTTIALERATNPFLRCGEGDIQQAASSFAGTELNSEGEVFRELRRWKDSFS